MKTVQNNRTTKFDIGDLIVLHHKYHRRRNPIMYKIIGFVKCKGSLCRRCSSGYVSYDARRFKKRLGIKPFSICDSSTPSYIGWCKIDPITKEIIDEERQE